MWIMHMNNSHQNMCTLEGTRTWNNMEQQSCKSWVANGGTKLYTWFNDHKFRPAGLEWTICLRTLGWCPTPIWMLQHFWWSASCHSSTCARNRLSTPWQCPFIDSMSCAFQGNVAPGQSASSRAAKRFRSVRDLSWHPWHREVRGATANRTWTPRIPQATPKSRRRMFLDEVLEAMYISHNDIQWYCLTQWLIVMNMEKSLRTCVRSVEKSYQHKNI